MCYNQPLSLCFFLIGFTSTFLAYKSDKLRKKYTHILTGFYTLMELSQAIEYSFVNQCNNVINTLVLSEFAYLLVVVQPLLFHYTSYLRLKDNPDQKIFKVSIFMFLCWLFFNLYARVMYDRNEADNTNFSFFYNPQTCIMRHNDTSHIYWQWSSLNMKDYSANFLNYLMIWFIPPFFVKKERIFYINVYISFLVGTYLTYLQGRWQEHASIWCYVSIPVSSLLLLKQCNTLFIHLIFPNQRRNIKET